MRSPGSIPNTTQPTCTTRCAASRSAPPSGFAPDCNVDDFALTPAERALLLALNDRGVRYLVVGLGAAVLEGAPVATQDLDIWLEQVDDPRVASAARAAGGFWISGFGLQPPAFGGQGLERLDVVLTAHGLDTFDVEYANAIPREIESVALRVLSLPRVIASKRATNRPKDRAALPALEATLAARESRQGETNDGSSG